MKIKVDITVHIKQTIEVDVDNDITNLVAQNIEAAKLAIMDTMCSNFGHEGREAALGSLDKVTYEVGTIARVQSCSDITGYVNWPVFPGPTGAVGPASDINTVQPLHLK